MALSFEGAYSEKQAACLCCKRENEGQEFLGRGRSRIWHIAEDVFSVAFRVNSVR